MISNLRAARPSPAIIVAVVALVAALAGTAVAQQATISAKAVTKKKSKKIANKEIDKRLPLGAADLADGAVTEAKIADVAVTNGKIGDGAVTTPKLGGDSVTSSKLGTFTERTEVLTVEDDATPFEVNEIDCNVGEQAMTGSILGSVLTDPNELAIARSNYDPNGGPAANDTGWLFRVGNLDDVAGVGDGDNASLVVTMGVVCLAP